MILQEIEALEEIISIFEKAETEKFMALLPTDKDLVVQIIDKKILNPLYWCVDVEIDEDWTIHSGNKTVGCMQYHTYKRKCNNKDIYPRIVFTYGYGDTIGMIPYDLKGKAQIMFPEYDTQSSLDWIKLLHQILVNRAGESIEQELSKPQKLCVRSYIQHEGWHNKLSPNIKVGNLFEGHGVLKVLEYQSKRKSIINKYKYEPTNEVVQLRKNRGYVDDCMNNFTICGEPFDGSLEEIVAWYFKYKKD